MRIEAGVTPGWEKYEVYHAEQMRVMHNVRWIDDETHQYATWHPDGDRLQVNQAKRIEVHEPCLIIINPLADDAGEAAGGGATRRHRPATVD